MLPLKGEWNEMKIRSSWMEMYNHFMSFGDFYDYLVKCVLWKVDFCRKPSGKTNIFVWSLCLHSNPAATKWTFPTTHVRKKRYVSMEEKRMCSSDFLEVQGQKHKLFLPNNISWNRSFRHMNYHEPLSRNLKVGKLQFNYGLFSYFRVLGCHRSLPCRLEAQTCPRTA